MLQRLFELLSFGCHHRRISKPFAAARASQTSSSDQWESLDKETGGGHYVVCLECGKKFGYDWARMKMIR
jgi:hypothetical protein